MFWLLVGEGWQLIFYDVAWQTNNATMFLFMAYRFFSGLLIGQLLIGVVITVYNEVTEIAASSSIRVYDAVEPLIRNLNTGDRETLIDDFVYLNWRLFAVHQRIERLADHHPELPVQPPTILRQVQVRDREGEGAREPQDGNGEVGFVASSCDRSGKIEDGGNRGDNPPFAKPIGQPAPRGCCGPGAWM
jgi:hypothetical protein